MKHPILISKFMFLFMFCIQYKHVTGMSRGDTCGHLRRAYSLVKLTLGQSDRGWQSDRELRLMMSLTYIKESRAAHSQGNMKVFYHKLTTAEQLLWDSMSVYRRQWYRSELQCLRQALDSLQDVMDHYSGYDRCGQWSEWGQCTVSCGQGQKIRQKQYCSKISQTKPCTQPECPAEIVTAMGTIKGSLRNALSGGVVEEYLGIPFGKARRFTDPEPFGSFPGGEYNAIKFGNPCPQEAFFPNIDVSRMSEDCLYLNVWVPRPIKENRAVLVFIYGGSFQFGADSQYVGKTIAALGDVIVVTFNYRLGALGFLSTGDERIKGNYGLKDQLMALRWIRGNIRSFAGDIDRVTIFGQSAGAASVIYHFTSNQSRGLFQRAIASSGSSLCPWAFMSKQIAKQRYQVFIKAVNCTDDADVLKCLQEKSMRDIVENQAQDTFDDFLKFTWLPTIDGDFMVDKPENTIIKAKGGKELMTGLTEDEGNLFTLLYAGRIATFQQFKFAVENLLPALDLDNNKTFKEVKNLYFKPNPSVASEYHGALMNLISDWAFDCPVHDTADQLTDKNNVYFYRFGYRASNSPWPEWAGVGHTDDVQWQFGWPFNKTLNYTKDEIQYSRDIITYWTNFVKYGNPNEDGLPNWPNYKSSAPSYLALNGVNQNFSVVKEKQMKKSCDFLKRFR